MTQKTKQIGYLTAIVVSVGSTIGAGIFFKNDQIFANAHGQLGFMIASWVLAAFGVMAIAFSLLELSSSSKNNGVTEFTNQFTKKGFAKFVSSYMILIYLPMNFLAMSLYAAMSLQDAIAADSGMLLTGWEVAAIAFLFFLWFVITGFFQKKIAISSQLLFTVIKFIPLIVVVFFSIAQIDNNGTIKTNGIGSSATGLTSVSPWLGLMASIPAILFAYDGFYTITSLKSDMKEPKKMGVVIALAISVITVSYLVFGIVTGLAGARDILEVSTITKSLSIMFNVFIMFAVFGIINGFGLGTSEIYYLTYKEHPIGLVGMAKKIFKFGEKDEKLAAWIVSAALSLLFFIVFVPVGIYGMGQGGYEGAYAPSAANLFSLADYITNYTSLLVFLFIGGSIFGGLANRKTNKVNVVKSKYFVPAAIISLIFLIVGAIYMVVANIVGITGYGDADSQSEIIKFVILVASIGVAFVPTLYDLVFKKGSSKSEAGLAKNQY